MTVGTVPELPAGLVDELRRQARRCTPTCPLYGELLVQLARDVERGGIAATLLDPYADAPLAEVVPGLRLLGAVHALVLEGRVPELAPFYPSVGGTAPPGDAWPVFRAVLVEHADEIRPRLDEPIQTNETGRAAALFGGLLVVSAATGLPIRLLEIGASAGLNLRADRFAYRVGDHVLGDPDSPLVLDQPWTGVPAVPLQTRVQVVERRGCDPRPLDVGNRADRLTLASLIWPDAVRHERFRAAVEIAAAVPAVVDAASADEWLTDRLAKPVPGVATVVWHSVVRQYVDSSAWQRFGDVLDRVGRFATADTPLAYLAFEPEVETDATYTFHLRLTLWPDGQSTTLATAPGHGIPTEWTMGS